MEKEQFTPAEPVKVRASFTLEVCEDANGTAFVRRANDGIAPADLIVHLESIKLDILLQLNTQLAERTKRTIITRTVVEKPAE